MVGDHYQEKWRLPDPNLVWTAPISRHEFDQLKKEVLEMKELLKRAIEYDKKNNQPHCEIEQKMDFLRQVAKSVGIDLDDVLNRK